MSIAPAHPPSPALLAPSAHRGLWAWLFPRPFDSVSATLYLGTWALFFYDRLRGAYGHPFIGWQAVLITVATGILLAVDRVEYGRWGDAPPPRVAMGLLLLRIGLIEVVAQLDDFSFSPFLYMIIPFTASLYFGTRLSYALAGLAWVAYIAKVTWYQTGWVADPATRHLSLLFTVGLVFAVAMARVVRNERASRARAEHLLAELEQSHQQLQAYAEQVGELATVRERNRLARDIHDSLGHYLTVINVQLEKALVFRDRQPAAADQAVGDAKRLAREALHDVRRSVGALRTTAPPPQFVLRDSLQTLVADTRSPRLRIDLRLDGDETGFSRPARMALYRAAQEGLTNVQKHAHATQVTLHLDCADGTAHLTIRDDGRGFDPATLAALAPGREGGYGLQGVQERLEGVGGSLTVRSAPGTGTSLLITVPRDEAAPLPVGVAGSNGRTA